MVTHTCRDDIRYSGVTPDTPTHHPTITISLLQTLPREVLNYLIPFTYCPQPKALCQDIRSYHKTINTLTQHYLKKFGSSDFPGLDATEWLSNDIVRYLNHNNPTVNDALLQPELRAAALEPFYLEVYGRHYLTRHLTPEYMREYIPRIDHKLYPRDIKILVGLLRPKERINLMTFTGIPDQSSQPYL